MNEKYIVDDAYLQNRGLNLSDYALDDTFIPAIITDGLDILISRICKLDDTIKSEKAIEKYLSEDDDNRTKEDKLSAFLKAQYRVIYNLCFQAETSPKDDMLDDIIVFELGLGKINGYQKGYYRKQD